MRDIKKQIEDCIIAWPRLMARTEKVEVEAGLLTSTYEELERLYKWVGDLQSGMFVNCVYCGHRYGPGETTPVSMADALKAHVAECPKHPMSELVRTLTAASQALKSYAHGNASPDLAKSIAEAADAALAAVSGTRP